MTDGQLQPQDAPEASAKDVVEVSMQWELMGNDMCIDFNLYISEWGNLHQVDSIEFTNLSGDDLLNDLVSKRVKLNEVIEQLEESAKDIVYQYYSERQIPEENNKEPFGLYYSISDEFEAKIELT